VSCLARLRRLVVAPGLSRNVSEVCRGVQGLSALTELEDLHLACGRHEPWAPQPSDLAPLTALTRLAMTALPLELASHPLMARLRRLDLRPYSVLQAAPATEGGGGGGGGTAAAALAALAQGAPLLERLRILKEDYPGGGALGSPLGAGIEWPSLEHLQVNPWAAVLLAHLHLPPAFARCRQYWLLRPLWRRGFYGAAASGARRARRQGAASCRSAGTLH
jgi:hypothetical protein